MRLIACAAIAVVFLLSGCGPSRQELMNEGLTQFQSGNEVESDATFHRLLDHYPSDPAALYYLGRLNHSQGNYAQAMYYYQAAIDADPSNQSAREYLKKAQLDSGLKAGTPRYAP